MFVILVVIRLEIYQISNISNSTTRTQPRLNTSEMIFSVCLVLSQYNSSAQPALPSRATGGDEVGEYYLSQRMGLLHGVHWTLAPNLANFSLPYARKSTCS